ncbi:MAG: hypothetical protein VKP62_04395 [Candidatus Sericytochromatia bacterium]|nr:hypothetical protein [Candidatus Sericytochromatia bacterium]
MTNSAVNGYFTTTTLPTPTPPPPPAGWPAPVTVPVNNAPGFQPQGTDAYIGAVAQYAPLVAGAVPGRSAAVAVGEAKGLFAKAARSKSASTAARAGQAGRSAMFGSVLGAVKSSALVNGVLTLAVNGYLLATGKLTLPDAGANVSGDMMSAVVGGAAGGAASALGTFALAGLLGTGLPLTLVGMGLGIAGYLVADTFLRQTKLYQDVKSSVRQLLA